MFKVGDMIRLKGGSEIYKVDKVDISFGEQVVSYHSQFDTSIYRRYSYDFVLVQSKSKGHLLTDIFKDNESEEQGLRPKPVIKGGKKRREKRGQKTLSKINSKLDIFDNWYYENDTGRF